jgi:hypothetical protein
VISDGPHRLDGPDGPVCMCGQPSRHESGWCGEEHYDLALKSFASEARERGPLDIKCPACTAKPGEHCAGVVDASKTFTEPHGQRITAAGATNDLEKARAKRARLQDVAFVRELQKTATVVIEALPAAKPDEHVLSLLVAAIGLCDAHECTRADVVEIFGRLAKDLPFPSAVLE